MTTHTLDLMPLTTMLVGVLLAGTLGALTALVITAAISFIVITVWAWRVGRAIKNGRPRP